jgi:hypothetical protein
MTSWLFLHCDTVFSRGEAPGLDPGDEQWV